MRAALRAATSLLLPVLATVAPCAAAEADHTAVPLYRAAFQTPVEAAGTGVAPEVTVRVRVDTGGRVAHVEIVSIRPTTGYDEYFERATRESLARWRYKPAMRDGEPVASILQWTVRFPSRAEKQQRSIGRGLLWKSGDERDAYHRKIMAMPLEARVKLLEGLAETASSHLDPEARRRAATPRVTVYTDAEGDGTAEKLARNIEASFNVLQDLLGDTIQPQPESYKVLVFMYADQKDYAALRDEVMSIDFADGFYNPAGILAFHTAMPTNESLLHLMLHEATHAYLDRYVCRPGTVLPRWLGEGFAEYVGNSSIVKGELVPGKTRSVWLYRTRWSSQAMTSGSMFNVLDVKKAVRTDRAIPLEEMLAADAATFYGERRHLFYASSWLLVHFLRHGDEGWAEEKFPAFMLYVAEGYPAVEVLEKLYGRVDDLESRFRRYVLDF